MSFFAREGQARRWALENGGRVVVKAWHNGDPGPAQNKYMFYIAYDTYLMDQIHNIKSATGLDWPYESYVFIDALIEHEGMRRMRLVPAQELGLPSGLRPTKDPRMEHLWSRGHSNLRM